MSNPMNDLINRLVLFVSYMSEEDLKKYPSRQNEELELKDQETSITSGQQTFEYFSYSLYSWLIECS